MFVRGDRGGPGEAIARQVVASFGYWNFASAEYLDLVFFGWYNEGGSVGFQPVRKGPDGRLDGGFFVDCYRQIERVSKWRYSGETDILLVDFEVLRTPAGELRFPGRFSFKNSIYLPVEPMIEDKRTRSLDGLVQELMTAAKQVYDTSPLQQTIFEISDRIGWTRGRRALWEQLKRMLLRDWSQLFDEVRPFAVCDLSV